MKTEKKNFFEGDSLRMFWNIVKGIGISSIVVGHCCGAFPAVIRFVYLYHLPIFFFVSGFLYSEKKYGDAPHIHVATRLRSTWPKYVGYMALYVLLHNFFLQYGIIVNASEYGINNLVIGLASAVTFAASETMGGALWFVPVLIVAAGLFGCIIYLSRTVERLTGKVCLKYVVAVLLTVLIGAFGAYANLYGMYFTWHIQTSFVVVPLFTIAWLISNNVEKWHKFLHWAQGIAACVLMIYGIKNWGWFIELSANTIIHPVGFYAVAMLGIYFCLVLAKYLLYIPGIRNIMSWFGNYSFDIMAGHFGALKLVDVIYAWVIHETDVQVYGQFPVAYSRILWPVYIVAGLLLPCLVASGYRAVVKKLFAARRV